MPNKKGWLLYYVTFIAILKSAPSGTTVTRINATDSDHSGRLRYTLVSGADGTFTVGLSDGVIKTTKSLDWEIKSNYTVCVLFHPHQRL